MPKAQELAATVERRFWPLLAVALLVFALGTFLWYPRDASETYYKPWKFTRQLPVPAIQLPWWQLDLAPGETLVVAQGVPVEAPDGRWFVEVLGHLTGSGSGGAITIDGREVAAVATPGPVWHRIFLDERPPVASRFEIAFLASDEDARFRVWGTLTQKKRGTRGRRPRLLVNGIEQQLRSPDPLPFRRGNLSPAHLETWKHATRSQSLDPFFRAGVRSRWLGTRDVGHALILGSVGVLAGVLGIAFAGFAVRHPRTAAAVFAITVTSWWLRAAAVEGLSDQYERTAGGITVRHNLWWDSGAYFTLAMQVFSNETPRRLNWPIGMSTFSAYLFQWSGLHVGLTKTGFAFLQTLVGPALFFACRNAVQHASLAFVPLVLWGVFLRPIKYSYYFLTDSLAMCLMATWIAMLVWKDPRERLAEWRWMVVAICVVFVLASYVRDVAITFLPGFLAMIWLFAGGTWKQRTISAAGALAVVLVLWSATPVLFANKSFSPSPIEFLAITPKHYESAQDRIKGERDSVGERILIRLARPWELYRGAVRFWNPHLRWANRAEFMTPMESVALRDRETRNPDLHSKGEPNVRAAYESSTPTRWLVSDARGGNYGRLLWGVGLTAAFGLAFSPRWRALALFLVYVTLFHALLFPGFTARPRAMFFPEVVLLASLGLFAAVEGLPAWLRARRARGAPSE